MRDCVGRRPEPTHFRTAFSGVFGAEAPNRAARAVGNDTAVANGAGPPPRQLPARFGRIRARAAVSRPSGRASLTQARVATIRAVAGTVEACLAPTGLLARAEVSPRPKPVVREGGLRVVVAAVSTALHSVIPPNLHHPAIILPADPHLPSSLPTPPKTLRTRWHDCSYCVSGAHFYVSSWGRPTDVPRDP